MANLYNNYNTGNSLAIQSNQQLVPNSSMNGMQFGSWNNSYTLNTRPTLNNQNTGII